MKCNFKYSPYFLLQKTQLHSYSNQQQIKKYKNYLIFKEKSRKIKKKKFFFKMKHKYQKKSLNIKPYFICLFYLKLSESML